MSSNTQQSAFASFLGAFILLVIGLVPLKYSYDYYHKAQNFLAQAVKLEAEVIRYEYDHACRGGTSSESRYPVVRVPDATGMPQELCTNVGSSHEAYEIGERIPVVYHPNDLTDVRENNFWGLWFIPSLFLVPGLFFVLLAGFRIIRILI